MSPPPIRDVGTTQYIQTRAVVGDQIEPLVTRCKVRTASAFTPPHSATPRFLEARPKTLIAFIPLDGRFHRQKAASTSRSASGSMTCLSLWPLPPRIHMTFRLPSTSGALDRRGTRSG